MSETHGQRCMVEIARIRRHALELALRLQPDAESPPTYLFGVRERNWICYINSPNMDEAANVSCDMDSCPGDLYAEDEIAGFASECDVDHDTR